MKKLYATTLSDYGSFDEAYFVANDEGIIMYKFNLLDHTFPVTTKVALEYINESGHKLDNFDFSIIDGYNQENQEIYNIFRHYPSQILDFCSSSFVVGFDPIPYLKSIAHNNIDVHFSYYNVKLLSDRKDDVGKSYVSIYYNEKRKLEIHIKQYEYEESLLDYYSKNSRYLSVLTNNDKGEIK